MEFSDLHNKLVEVRAKPYGRAEQPQDFERVFFYHGQLKGETDNFIVIDDMKSGEMRLNKKEIISIKPMNSLEIKLMSKKLDTIGDHINMRRKLEEEIKELDRRLDEFRRKI